MAGKCRKTDSSGLTSAPVALGEIEGSEALYAPMLRPAPVDAALLVAVHRGLEAVPVFPSTAREREDGAGEQGWAGAGVPTPPCGSAVLGAAARPARPHGALAQRRRG